MNALARRASRLFLKVRRHGLGKVIHNALLTRLARRLRFYVLRCYHVADVAPAFLDLPPAYAASFLTRSAIREVMRDPRFQVSEQFVQEALTKGDKCYGVSRNGALSAYSWYATTPTLFLPGLRLHFNRDYVYMYKAFTLAPHRGRRLYPAGVTRALRHYRAIGYKGLLAYVEATNVDSLKSFARMGFEAFGSVYVLEAFGRSFVYATPGCARFGFCVERASRSRPARTGSPHRA
jgi:hypothetical protein